MGLKLEYNTINGGIPIFNGKVITAPGGFNLDINGLTPGEVLKAGTVMTYDETTRKAKKATASGSPKVSDAKGLLYEDVVIEASADLAVVISGTVYQNRIPDMAADEAAHKAALPRITFSKSY